MNTAVKKIVSVFLALIMILFIGLQMPGIDVHASTTGKIINVNSYVNMRSKASTAGSVVVTVPLGTSVTINSTATHEADDTSGQTSWYNVSVTLNSKSYTGYIASYYVQKDSTTPSGTDAAFETAIAGFPESYKPYLRSLHAAHPNWVFNPVNTGIDWSAALDLETVKGTSLVQSTTDSLYQSKTFTDVVDSPNWVNASRAIVAYYMDPRNMMSEESVFQFLNLSYTASSIDEKYIDGALNGTFMASPATALYAPSDAPLYYKQIFAIAGNESGINPIFLVSHAIQECGSQGSTSSNGTMGVYNFFNIGAYSSVINASRVGLAFAKSGLDDAFNAQYNIPWDTPGKSIIYGAKWIADHYTNCGQNTIYFFRFDFNPSSSYTVGTHQYMTATQSVNSEGRRMYSVYEASGNIDSALQFYIPVYNNMPDSACPIPSEGTVFGDFVSYEYQTLLGRAASSTDVSSWSSELAKGTSGSILLSGLVQSAEFKNRNLSNEDFINVMAKAALGRTPTSSELSYANSLFAQNYSRLKVLEYFVNLSGCQTFYGHYGVAYGTFTDSDAADSNIEVQKFVELLYEGTFKREGDSEGIKHWTNQIASGAMTGTDVAAFFFTSNEFINGGYSNAELITRLYQICFNRAPDTSGFNYWNGLLESSHSREYVIAGIINSAEFASVCQSYGVTPGGYVSKTTYAYSPDAAAVNSFVTRLYSCCFERTPDEAGLNYWTGCLMTVNDGINSITGYDIASGFVFSNEMNSLNLSNSEFVSRLYTIFLDRTPDSAGLDYWVGRLNNGESRQTIFDGFAYSDEYQNLCMSSGICPNDNFK